MEFIKLNSLYEDLICPSNLIKVIDDFEGWLDLGSKEDLQCCLEAFINEDMFEECIIIQNKINAKV